MENPGFNRRLFLQGIGAAGALNAIPETLRAEDFSDVQNAPDTMEFPMYSYYIYKGFSMKLNKESSGCVIEPHSFSSDTEGDRFHFSVEGTEFAHDFRTDTEKQDVETVITYTEFKSRMISFLNEQEGLDKCFPMS